MLENSEKKFVTLKHKTKYENILTLISILFLKFIFQLHNDENFSQAGESGEYFSNNTMINKNERNYK